MVCYITCGLSISFMIASIIMMITPKHVEEKLVKLLDKEQKEIYTKIVKERLMLYIQGLVLGVIFGILFMNKFAGINNTIRCCGFGLVVAIITILYYHIMPKSNWMVMHLKSREQNRAWIKMYKYMKHRWHSAFLVSMAGISLITFGYYK